MQAWSNSGKSLLNLFDLGCRLLWLIVKLRPNLLLSFHFSLDLVSCGLCYIVGMELEILLFELLTPLGNHLSKAARAVSTSEDGRLCRSFGLD